MKVYKIRIIHKIYKVYEIIKSQIIHKIQVVFLTIDIIKVVCAKLEFLLQIPTMWGNQW